MFAENAEIDKDTSDMIAFRSEGEAVLKFVRQLTLLLKDSKSKKESALWAPCVASRKSMEVRRAKAQTIKCHLLYHESSVFGIIISILSIFHMFCYYI